MRFKDRFTKIVPVYAFIPLFMCLAINAVTYYGTRIFTTGREHIDMSVPADALIPFVPQWIIVYVLSYFFWIVGFIVIARESREVCGEVLCAEQISKLICLVMFMLLPATMNRPEIGNSVFDRLVGLIYASDPPDNLFPSIHCMDSWLCFRGAMKCKKVGRGYKVFCFVFSVLVFVCVVLVKQHVLVDIAAGVAVAELGLLISKLTGAGRIYRCLKT